MPSKKSKEKNKKRLIPAKNYLILGTIIVVTLLICVYLFSWLKQYNDSQNNGPIITNTLREVEYNNLNEVLRERNILILYMCTTTETICHNFENKFANYIKENNLTEEIVYLNLGEKTDENNHLNAIYNKYKSQKQVKKIHKYPALLVFSNGEIVDVLSVKNRKKLTIKQVDEFLEGYDL